MEKAPLSRMLALRADVHQNENAGIFTSGKNFLLLIGIDAYANGVRPLENAVLDAAAFREWLQRYSGFQHVSGVVEACFQGGLYARGGLRNSW